VAWFSAITFPLVRASLKGKVVRAAELVDRLKHEELVTLPTLTREEIEITGSSTRRFRTYRETCTV
jgi:DNA polymerase III delta subunit